MLKIKYTNLPAGVGKTGFLLRYVFNQIRTWYIFNFKYPWVKYEGFIRVMSHTSFAKMCIRLGHNVQFGNYCNIASNVLIGNNVLVAGRVCFVGRMDHDYTVPGQLIWDGSRKDDGVTVVEDDVWIGHGCTVIAGVTIGRGSVIAAGSLVNRSIPPCEIWGGVPAKKLKDRFVDDEARKKHLQFLDHLTASN
jgi:chloramphenicol O-acetyltransferase type B